MSDPTPPSTEFELPGDRLDAFREDARTLAIELFIQRHGTHFFVLQPAPDGDLHAPPGAMETQTIDLREIEDGPQVAHDDFRVLSIRKTSRSASVGFISVGRTRNNDVVIRDVSVSKFHAFLRQRGDEFLLQDVGSRNGTTVDGVPVPKRGEGEPVVLTPGSHVAFGAIEFVFIDAARLVDLARQ